jgi:carboxyl-terminal processing protease
MAGAMSERGSFKRSALAALLVVSCGDGADLYACDVEAEKVWLRGYMRDWYLWAASAPNPAPDDFATVSDYFTALLFTGNGAVPPDRWSYIYETADFDRLYVDGQVLGYGLFVNDQVLGYSDRVDPRIDVQLPLKVRFTEAESPVGEAGLKRGDTIVSINDRPSADIVADNDFAALVPVNEGEHLKIVIDNGSGPTTYDLISRTYPVTPVPVATVLSSANGIQVGYLVLSAFITQADAPLTQALDSIRRQGATELIIDLRYDTGGRNDTATLLASLIVGYGHAGETFVETRYNAAHRDANVTAKLSSSQAPAFSRVLVITGPRTCSASELLINGLKPYADVVTLGGSTCGKPEGFAPELHCGVTYAPVIFEAVNSLGQGQYYDGIPPTCPVADDFSSELGSPSEKLTAAALDYIDGGGSCHN